MFLQHVRQHRNAQFSASACVHPKMRAPLRMYVGLAPLRSYVGLARHTIMAIWAFHIRTKLYNCGNQNVAGMLQKGTVQANIAIGTRSAIMFFVL